MIVRKGKRRIARKKPSVIRRVRRQTANVPQLLRSEQTPQSFPIVRDTTREPSVTRYTEAFVAVFDISGFTPFCNQVGSTADIPTFLNDFTAWLFEKIEQKNAASDGVITDPLWKESPFFAKFLGDGMLLLWDAGNMTDMQIARLITALSGVCDLYRNEFYKKTCGYIANPPRAIRCRVSRGTVFSVNNGRDYVGQCINVAMHLLKYKLFSFCIASESFNITESIESSLATHLLPLSLPIKGIKTNEPAWVLRTEFESLRAENSSILFEDSPP